LPTHPPTLGERFMSKASTAPAPLLKISDLHKEFHQGNHCIKVLKGVSFELEKGSFTSLVGESGSGKTTFLQIIGALDAPTRGSVQFEGMDVHKLGPIRRARYRQEKIGFIFQSYQLLPDLTAQENIVLAGQLTHRPMKKVIQRAQELMVRMRIEHRKDHRPAELSGGEQQRVAIARALMNDPPLILADEPTGNVDPQNVKTIMELLRELRDKENKTILMVTHNMELARQTDQTYRFKDGILIKCKTSE
ncbi:MAG: ABC transporter ATP-binding protein, partial [Lentisphaerae bacterium]